VAEGLVEEELTFRIIGVAMEVHRELGPGFLESVYEDALCYEFDRLNIPYQRQLFLNIHYKDVLFINKFRAGLLVDKRVLIENKAEQRLTALDNAQLLNCLRVTGIRVGLLFNFGTARLEFRRRIM
jgi:GxxExxY protein